MKKIQLLCGSTVIVAAAFAAPVLAQSDSGYRGPQPVPNAPTPQVRVIDKEQAEREQQQRMQMQRAPQSSQAQPQAMKPQPSRQVYGLAFNSENRGSGPDKTKFNIVNEDEARRQQGRLNQGGGDQGSDGTGGSDSSGGGR
ncbi:MULTISPECIES: hypothetical protein [Hydrocarboniphaga]|uniref:Secreted protein n=1 Tax=Hydrocarboniphaga effusa AP103 TaxID=1172194 RepID=I7ZK35_9GAMM|nr:MULTISPECIES: hypothetical protein [Hydrocarboniphaga]EIT72117.1 hypothetical protein WQQ_22540 [Hydrocarboniphaga effusa AP103]MDZ4078996.1 hypothetical protein [Hydrocarboniphaga sp.]